MAYKPKKERLGTNIEVFKWLSTEAIQNAHKNPVVQQILGEYAELSAAKYFTWAIGMFAMLKPLK